ncbi:unnamed protein product, partial [marine sediment metagenome]
GIKKRIKYHHIINFGVQNHMNDYKKEPIQRCKRYIKNTIKIGLVGAILFGVGVEIKGCAEERNKRKAYERKLIEERTQEIVDKMTEGYGKK